MASASACEIAASRSVSAKARRKFTRWSASVGDLDLAGLGRAHQREQPVGDGLGRVGGEEVDEAAARPGHRGDDLVAVERAVAVGVGAGEPRDGAGLTARRG